MKNMFSHDSKLMAVLAYVGDLFILNVLFLVSCMPIVTIGAALAGLHNAARILQDPEDDRSAIKGYFRGFAQGFWKITLGHLLFLIIDAVLAYSLYVSFVNHGTGLFVHWGVPLAGLIFALLYQNTMVIFHSQFSCTFGQLLRNSAMMMIWHPLVSIMSTVLICAPIALYLLAIDIFAQIGVLFLTVYFSFACIMAQRMNKKAFKMLIDHYNNPEGLEPEDEELFKEDEA